MRLFTEPAPVPDIFASGLADAEYLGDGNVRLTFYRQRRQLHGTNGRGGSVDLEVISCIVMPVAAFPAAREKATIALIEVVDACRLGRNTASSSGDLLKVRLAACPLGAGRLRRRHPILCSHSALRGLGNYSDRVPPRLSPGRAASGTQPSGPSQRYRRSHGREDRPIPCSSTASLHKCAIGTHRLSSAFVRLTPWTRAPGAPIILIHDKTMQGKSRSRTAAISSRNGGSSGV